MEVEGNEEQETRIKQEAKKKKARAANQTADRRRRRQSNPTKRPTAKFVFCKLVFVRTQVIRRLPIEQVNLLSWKHRDERLEEVSLPPILCLYSQNADSGDFSLLYIYICCVDWTTDSYVRKKSFNFACHW